MNKFEKEVQAKGCLPSNSFPGLYPIYYLRGNTEVLCPECASKEPENIEHQSVHWEGKPLICEECNAEIESAYGDPEEE